MKFYKIVNPEGHYGLIYKEGLNIDPNPFNPSGDCVPGGIYFSREDILAFLDYGTELYEVEPVGEIYENLGSPKKWKAHAIKLYGVGKVIDNIEFLIKEGANVHAINDYALRWAVRNGHYEVVKLLLEYGADVHANNDYALRWAAEHGHYEVVKLLLEYKADVHASNDYALRWVVRNGHYEVVKLLLEYGANVHANNDYALRWAAERGHSHVVELLKKYT